MSAARKRTKKAESKAAADKAAAARAERSEEPRSVTWKGITFDLPAAPPESILFDFIAIEAGGASPAPTFRMLQSLVGEKQFLKMRQLVERGEAKAGDVFDLVNEILGQYGVDEGEVEASQDS